MKSLRIPVFVTALLLVVAPLLSAPASHPDTSGWKSLFAADLADADLKDGSWVWENGTLVARTRDTIWTKKPYANFVLDLEFKVAKESNSGVFLRSGNTKQVLSALEIQVHDSADGALYGEVGSIYTAKSPAKKMA